jgi:hypothetical protein
MDTRVEPPMFPKLAGRLPLMKESKSQSGFKPTAVRCKRKVYELNHSDAPLDSFSGEGRPRFNIPCLVDNSL